MSRPRLLDAYCCAGGATRGYQLAGWHVTGVDVVRWRDYCGDEFIQGDAVTYIREHGHEYDAIHASPPCQGEHPLTTGTNKGRTYPLLIPATREAVQGTRRPWVIENTAGNAIRKDLTLNGDMFRNADGTWRLGVWRPRYYELSAGLTIPQPDGPRRPSRGYVRGWRHGIYRDGPYVAVYGKGGGKATLPEAQAALEMPWVTDLDALREAIPPAHTEHIGTWLLRAVEASA